MVSCLRWNSSSLRCRSDSSAAHLHPPQSTGHITVVRRQPHPPPTAISQTTDWCLIASVMPRSGHAPRYVAAPFGEACPFLCQPLPHGITLGRELLLHRLSCPSRQWNKSQVEFRFPGFIPAMHNKPPNASSVSTALPDALSYKEVCGAVEVKMGPPEGGRAPVVAARAPPGSASCTPPQHMSKRR